LILDFLRGRFFIAHTNRSEPSATEYSATALVVIAPSATPVVAVAPVSESEPIVAIPPVSESEPIVAIPSVSESEPIVVISPVSESEPIVAISPVSKSEPIVAASPVSESEPRPATVKSTIASVVSVDEFPRLPVVETPAPALGESHIGQRHIDDYRQGAS
jgi:hypothetical protein